MSFRSKSVFNTLLRNNLTSNLWNSIKDSLLGSELIAYAAEFLYQQELLADGVVSSVYPSGNSGLLNLLLCGNFNNVAFSYYRPATITVRLNGFETPQYFEPFTIKLSKGNVVYTNIDWVSSESPIVLYQGVPRVVDMNGYGTNLGRFPQVSQTLTSAVYRTSSNSDFYSYFINLESLPYTDSVYVYSINANGLWTTYQLYDSINADKDAKNYKLIWSNDLKLQVHFGNSIWGRNFQTSEKYYVYFLDSTFNAIDTTGLVLSVEGTDNSYLNGVTHEIVSYQEYSLAPDVSYQNLQNALNKTSVIATIEQVEKFVESFPLVRDSKVMKNQIVPNTVDIYVKPETSEGGSSVENFNESDFTDITEALQTYGEIVTRYAIHLANVLKLRIVVTVLDYVSAESEVSQQIQRYVSEKFTDTSIGDSVDFSKLSNEIYGETGYRNIVRFYMSSEVVQNGQLNSLPVISTLKNIGSWEGNIDNGYLFKHSSYKQSKESASTAFAHATILGDFVLASDTYPYDSVKDYIMVSGNECKDSIDSSSVMLGYSAISSAFTTERMSTSISLSQSNPYPTNNAVSGFDTLSINSVQNFGFLSNDNDYNLYSPEVGAVNLDGAYSVVSTGTISEHPLKNYFSNGTLFISGYGNTAYFLNNGSSSCVLSAYDIKNQQQVSSYSFSAYALSQLDDVKGMLSTDDSLLIFNATDTRAYVFSNYQSGLSVPSYFPWKIYDRDGQTETNVHDSILVGPTVGISTSRNNTAFLTCNDGTELIDGKHGVLVIDPSDSTYPQSYTVFMDSDYVLFIFTYPNSSTQFTLHTTEGAANDEEVTLFSRTHDNLIYYTFVKIQMNNATSKTYYLQKGTGAYIPVTFTKSSNITFELNIGTLPKMTNGAVSLNIEQTYSLSSLFSHIPNPATNYYNSSNAVTSLSLIDFHIIGKGEDDEYFLLADIPYVLDSDDTMDGQNVVSHQKFSIFKVLVRCYFDGTNYISEFVTDLSLLSKVGAFDSTGKLTMFTSDDVTGLTVSYETQNSYFTVDSTSYAELDNNGVIVKFV